MILRIYRINVQSRMYQRDGLYFLVAVILHIRMTFLVSSDLGSIDLIYLILTLGISNLQN